jgi:preprotein translocase subunit SecE
MTIGYILISFFAQLGEWFELESKISNYMLISNIVSVLLSVGVFAYIITNKVTSEFLRDVYAEAVKVVWPDKNDTVRMTVVIMIGVTIVGFILWIFDYLGTLFMSLIQDFVK